MLSCSRSPALVTDAYIIEFDLENNPIDQRGRSMYAERAIHGCGTGLGLTSARFATRTPSR